MGKKNFDRIYRNAKQASGGTLRIKISSYSDRYDAGKDFAGLIIYHKNDQHIWRNTAGRASGQRGRSFYVVIQDTSKWPAGAIHDRAGRGMVHDHLYKSLTGEEWTEGVACCGGFAIRRGTVKHSSVWLNTQSCKKSWYTNSWESDSSKNLSPGEQAVVNQAIREWKAHGPNRVFEVPRSVERQVLGLPQERPNPVRSPSTIAEQLRILERARQSMRVVVATTPRPSRPRQPRKVLNSRRLGRFFTWLGVISN